MQTLAKRQKQLNIRQKLKIVKSKQKLKVAKGSLNVKLSKMLVKTANYYLKPNKVSKGSFWPKA